MRSNFLEECTAVEQNSLYSAETHHQMAVALKRQADVLQIGLALVAAGASVINVFLQTGPALPLISAISAAGAGLAAALNPNKRFEDHLSAAKAFTVLRHDARFLRDAEALALGDEGLAIRVTNLHGQYNSIVRTAPPTAEKFFERAREKIKSGRHDLDRPNV